MKRRVLDSLLKQSIINQLVDYIICLSPISSPIKAPPYTVHIHRRVGSLD
jgi:hypothetical protein